MKKRTTTTAAERDKDRKRQSRALKRQADVREEILHATRTVVLRDGLDAFTLEALARELGLTKQAVYYYFSSKDRLLFALTVEEWLTAARVVNEATSQAESGEDALEALIRSYVTHYAGTLELFVLVTQRLPGARLTDLTAVDIEQIRPVNDLFYGPTEKRLAAEKRRGQVPASVHPRRLAFSAHVAAMGLLAMKAMVEQHGDPLKHKDEDLVNELCQAFRARCRP